MTLCMQLLACAGQIAQQRVIGLLFVALADCRLEWHIAVSCLNGPLCCTVQYIGANTYTEQQKLANYNGTAIASKYGWHPQVGSAAACTGLVARLGPRAGQLTIMTSTRAGQGRSLPGPAP
jgi:hypothetical protein